MPPPKKTKLTVDDKAQTQHTMLDYITINNKNEDKPFIIENKTNKINKV